MNETATYEMAPVINGVITPKKWPHKWITGVQNVLLFWGMIWFFMMSNFDDMFNCSTKMGTTSKKTLGVSMFHKKKVDK